MTAMEHKTGSCKMSSVRKFRLWLWAGAALGLVLVVTAAFACLTYGWDKPLLGPHAFRQTQTAISSYYMVRHPEMFLRYITPVLGKPWEIPMEVPYYQWLVARWHTLTGMPLDAAGRFVSVFFLLACLWPITLLMRALGTPWAGVWVSWCLILSSPLYLFWSNAFLIESTGLFLVLGMTAFLTRALRHQSPWDAAVAFLFGLLAITCKATTWAIAAGASLLLIFYLIGRENLLSAVRNPLASLRGPKLRLWMVALLCAVSLALCFIVGKMWLDFADKIKSKNIFARELIIANSENQKRWNYGTLEQKLDPATWQGIGRHIASQLTPEAPLVGSIFLPAVLMISLVFARGRRLVPLIFLAVFAAGPLVFTNLYFEHSYYWMANGVWLLLAAGDVAGRLLSFPKVPLGGDKKNVASVWLARSAVTLTVVLTLILSGFAQWRRIYFPILQNLPSQASLAKAFIEPAQKTVLPGRTLLVLGHDWNPAILYYAERKGIAFPTAPWIPFPCRQLDEALGRFEEAEELGGVLVGGTFLNTEFRQAVEAFLAQIGAAPPPVQTPFGLLFRVQSGRDKTRF